MPCGSQSRGTSVQRDAPPREAPRWRQPSSAIKAPARPDRRRAPPPGRGEVLVRVNASGGLRHRAPLPQACKGLLGAATTPIILGQEVAGTAVEMGEGVEAFAVGNQVAVHSTLRTTGSPSSGRRASTGMSAGSPISPTASATRRRPVGVLVCSHLEELARSGAGDEAGRKRRVPAAPRGAGVASEGHEKPVACSPLRGSGRPAPAPQVCGCRAGARGSSDPRREASRSSPAIALTILSPLVLSPPHPFSKVCSTPACPGP